MQVHSVARAPEQSGAFPIASTRIHGPRRFVTTAAFYRLLESDSAIVILAAPAGYGKSSLLRAIADTCAARGKTCAWRGPDIAPADRSVADVDVILIDDAHLATDDRLLQIIRSASNGNLHRRLVVATRTLPDADWLSLEATGLVEIFRPEELALSRSETEAMLDHYAHALPSPGQLDQICAITEGWPIAVQWFGLLARRRSGWSRLVIGAGQSRDELGRYLNEMIYAELDASLREFLFDIADLGQFQATMLGDIMARDGRLMLNRLRHENLLVQSTGDETGHLRLHGLLQSFLEQKMLEEGRTRNLALLDQARQWCVDKSRYPEAVEYAIRAGRLDQAHDLLADHCVYIINVRGELPAMLRWTDHLRRAGVMLRPAIALWRVWALILEGELGRAEVELECVRGNLSADVPNALHLHAARLELSLVARREAPEVVVALADSWFERWGSHVPFHSAAIYVLRALAHHAQGQLAAALRDLASARRAALDCDGLYAQVWVAKAEAYIGLRAGRILQARDTALTTIDLVRRDGTVSMATLGTLHLLASRIFVELRDFVAAREHLTAGHLHLGDTGLIEIHLAATEAAVLIAEEDSVEAALREIQIHPARNLRSCVESDLFAVRLLLRHKRIVDASELFEASFRYHADAWQHLGHGSMISASLAPAVRLVEAQLQMACGRVAEADAVCAELLPIGDTRAAIDDYLGLLFLAAGTAHTDGRRSDARRLLIRAIRVAAERSALHSAHIASWPIRTMLVECDDLGEGLGAEGLQLLGTIRQYHGLRFGADDAPALVEALTPREMDVLAMLDSGLNSDAIAVRLDMGLSTVKWHMRNIYGKLGVRNRSGALARSRRLGLIKDLAH